MISHTYKGVTFNIEITISSKNMATVEFGRIIDEDKGQILVNYVLKTLFTGIVEHSLVQWLIQKIVKKRLRKACKLVYNEVQTGRYNVFPKSVNTRPKKFLVDGKIVEAKPGEMIPVDSLDTPIIPLEEPNGNEKSQM